MIQFSLKRISTVGPKSCGQDRLRQTRLIPRSPDGDNKHELTTSTEGHVSPFSQNSLSDCKSSGWTNQVNSTLILCGTLIRSTSVEPSGCRSDKFFTQRCFPLICLAMSNNFKRVNLKAVFFKSDSITNPWPMSQMLIFKRLIMENY